MGAQAEGFRLSLEFSLDATPERVFQALTEPAELTKWWGPRGFKTPQIDLDLRVGGTYRFGMKPPDGDLFHLSGQFLEIEPTRRLVYTFRWDEPTPDDRETVVTLVLDARGAATKLALTQGLFATEERLALHRDGWTESFEKLRALVEARG